MIRENFFGKEKKNNQEIFERDISVYLFDSPFRSWQEIESIPEEEILERAKKEIRNIKEKTKKIIENNIKAKVFYSFLSVDPEKLKPEEAKIWEKFKLVKNLDDLREISREFEVYAKRKNKEIIDQVLEKEKEFKKTGSLLTEKEKHQIIKRLTEKECQFIHLISNLILYKKLLLTKNNER